MSTKESGLNQGAILMLIRKLGLHWLCRGVFAPEFLRERI